MATRRSIDVFMPTSNQSITITQALRIAGYSWPLYTAAGLGIVVAVVILFLPGSPLFLRWLAGLGAVVALWFTFASFWAFHSMFDRSELLGGEWLKEEVPRAPGRWVQINAGLAETTLPLDRVFPGAEGKMLDLYDPAVMTEPAVSRARQRRVAKAERSEVPGRAEDRSFEDSAPAISGTAQPDSLPVDDG
jgi:hypothetical protein